ncbi:MAG: HAMP domain-containing protein [Deltaproteobacteria bacterium]|nr:HAMP domain-containing protein [Deltaproteobacteria bacterium]
MKRRSVRTTVLIAITLVGGVSILLVGAGAFFSATAPLRVAIESELRGAAGVVANAIGEFRKDKNAQLGFWSRLDIMQEVVTDDADGKIAVFLARAIELDTGFVWLAVHDAQGKPVARSSPAVPDQMPPVLDAFSKGPLWAFSFAKDGRGLLLAVPIASRADPKNVIGVIWGLLPERTLRGMLEKLASSKNVGEDAALVDAADQVLVSVAGGVQTLDEQQSVVGVAELGGPKPEERWRVLVRRPASTVFASVRQLEVVLALTAAIVGVIVVLLGFLVSKRITRPISVLKLVVDDIRRTDDLSLVVPIGGDREIADLGSAMNELVARLAVARTSLRRHTESLEEQVRERTQEVHQKNAALEAEARYKSRFFAMMSHELRTPLQGIIGFAELTLTSAGSRLDEQGRANLQSCIDSAEHLVTIVTNLLDLTKAEAGAMRVKSSWFELAPLASECVSVANAAIGKVKTLAITADVPSDLPRLFLDPLLVRQIITNLVGNAVKFTKRGFVRVSARRLAGAHVRIEVEDSGPGIPAHEIPRMFEEFSQADDGGTREHGGTGLGLAIVRKFTALLGGRCGATSVVGVGSTFWIELPLSAETTERDTSA